MARSLNARFKSIPYITLPGTFILLSTAASHPLRSTPAIVLPSAHLSLPALAAVRATMCDTLTDRLRSCSLPTRSIFGRPVHPRRFIDIYICIKRSRSSRQPKRRNVRTREMQALRTVYTVQHRTVDAPTKHCAIVPERA